MSYIRAHRVNIDSDPTGTTIRMPDGDQPVHIDANLDDEMLSFVVSLISLIDDLPEGEAIVVWKEIF